MKSYAAAAAFLSVAFCNPALGEAPTAGPENQGRTLLEQSFCTMTAVPVTGIVVIKGADISDSDIRVLSAAFQARAAKFTPLFREMFQKGRDATQLAGVQARFGEVVSEAVKAAKAELKGHHQADLTYAVFTDRRHACREIVVMRA